ncbi:MAG TPA: alpha/beta hydrolase [Candidatus Limnocylindria bacterium]|jgi:pimeloyl-ACP methyl ester carboxylesterase
MSSASTATAASGAFQLDLPAGRGPHGAIVPLHPASDRSRDQALFAHLAAILPPRGVAVLRYDRRGDDVPFADQVADASAAMDALLARTDVDPSRLGLWGFSQGAWIAPMVAAGSGRARFLVLLASTGVSPAGQMRYGTVKHARDAGYGEDVARRIIELRDTLEHYARGSLPRRRAQQVIDAAADEPWFEHAYVRAELPAAPGFWPDLDFDPAAIFARVTVPTLLFYGEDDEWQPIDASIAAWRRAAEKAGNSDLEVVRLAGTGHAPMLHGGDDRGSISPEYETRLLDWLARHGFASA